MKKKTSIPNALFVCLLLVASIVAVNLSAFTGGAAAAGTPDSCSPPATTYGTDTMSVYVPITETYTIWTRMQAPSSSANSILLNVDNTNCYNVGGDSSIPTNSTWDWVDDYDGSTSNLVNVALSSGTHTFTLTGTESGVSIDRIIAIPVTSGGAISCTPSNTQDDTAGTNCAPLSNTATAPPTVSVTSPSGGATVSGTATTISATATDSIGIASVQFELDGSALGSPVVVPSSGNTYSYSWNTTSAGNGSHTISAIATDTSGYTTTTGSTSVTVNNSTGGGATTPATPADLRVTTNAGRSVALAWTNSSGATSYRLYQNGTLIASPTGTSYTSTGLTPGTAYSYTIAAYNASASPTISSQSAAVADTTCHAGDIKCTGTVGLPDLLTLSQNWGNTSGTATWAQGDLNGDGDVGLPDLLILSQNWGETGP